MKTIDTIAATLHRQGYHGFSLGKTVGVPRGKDFYTLCYTANVGPICDTFDEVDAAVSFIKKHAEKN